MRPAKNEHVVCFTVMFMSYSSGKAPLAVMGQKMGILGRKMTSFAWAILKHMRDVRTQKWRCI
jgi:hypothetical protein